MASGHWEVTFQFESVGGRKYRTIITLKAQVLTGFKFIEIEKMAAAVAASDRDTCVSDAMAD